MNKAHMMKSVLISISLSLAALILYSCDQAQPLSPTNSVEAQSTGLSKKGKGSGGDDNDVCANADQSSMLLVRKREEEEEGTSRALIGPEGGVLVHAAHRLIIPAGALDEQVELTFSMPVSDTLKFEFGPDGIQFNQPVQIVVSYDHACTSGIDDTDIYIVVWNPGAQEWDQIPSTVDTEFNLVTGEATHFSRYAFSKR